MSELNQSYAGFWRRFAAYMIDWVILGYFLNSMYWFLRNQLMFSNSALGDVEIITNGMLFPLTLIVTWCYYSGLESSPLQATLGKLLLGIYVTDLEGNRISFGQATGRYFGKIISALIILIGYIMAGFTEKKQALHDIMANCLVLRK